MSVDVADRLLTVEEFYLLSDPPEGGKMELVRGRVVISMPPSGAHGRRLSRIDRRLGNFIEEHDLGVPLADAGFLLARAPDVCRAPDFAFVDRDELADKEFPEQGWLPFVPTLAVEVISPNDRDSEIQEKVADYEAAGVSRIWLVRPKNQTVTVYWSDGRVRTFRPGEVLTSEEAGFAVAGFEMRVDEVVDLKA